MRLSEAMSIAWEGLTANKVRSLLTTLGVIIGVAAVIMMMAISAGTEAAIANQISALGANLVIISPMRGVPSASRSLTYDDVEAIAESVNHVVGITAEPVPVSQVVRANNVVLEDISVVGAMADFPTVRDVEVADGRFFSPDDLERKAKVVVLGAGVAQDLFGDAPAVGQEVTIGSTKMTVIGVTAERGMVADVDFDGRVYLPITVVYQRYVSSTMQMNTVRSIYLKADSQEMLQDVIAQVTSLLVHRHNLDQSQPDFTVQTQQDIISTQEAATEAFRNLLAWVAAVSLVVGGIGIMNIMLVSVTERTREIGLRGALGATPGDLRAQFLLEALMLSLVGGLAGVLLGVGGSTLFGQLGDMPVAIVPASVPMAFGAAAMVGLFFGYLPANRAAQLDPIQALRHE